MCQHALTGKLNLPKIHTGFFRRALSVALNFLNLFWKSYFWMTMKLSAVSAVVWDLAFRYFMVHRFAFFGCASDVGKLAHQPCCHEPSCTLLRLQPISNMFGVRVCGSPPHLMMNRAKSSKCPPKLSQGTLVRFRKIARRLFWRVSSLLETSLSRASFHKACFMCLVSLGIQRFSCAHNVWLAQGKSLGGDSLPAFGAALNDIL